MKKFFAAIAMLALAYIPMVAPAYTADAPTLHYDGATCPSGNSQFNIDALGVAFAKVHDKMNLPNPKLLYLDGEELAKFDAAIQAKGGPAKPDNVAAVVYILYDGWNDDNTHPVSMLLFDKDGCFITGKLVPSKMIIDGEGQEV